MAKLRFEAKFKCRWQHRQCSETSFGLSCRVTWGSAAMALGAFLRYVWIPRMPLLDETSALSVYLSLSPSAPHTQYRKRGSASYIVREVRSVRERERETEVVRRKWRHHCRAEVRSVRERERERETERGKWWDGSDVTIVALKLAMSLHFPLRHHCGAEVKFAMGSHFPLPHSHLVMSASYIVREVHRWERERDTERERERERVRRKWRHHCRAKIGDEFCTSPCQKCAP